MKNLRPFGKPGAGGLCLLLALVGLGLAPMAAPSDTPPADTPQAGTPIGKWEETEFAAFEGVLLKFTGSFCCSPGYRYALDGDCRTPVGILSQQDDFLDLFVGYRVIIYGWARRCPPLPGCPCQLQYPDDQDAGEAAAGFSRYGCMTVEAIDFVEACAPTKG